MTKNRELKGCFPFFADIRDKKTVVIGAGKIASRRIETMTQFCGNIVVVAPEASELVLALAEEGCITFQQKPYEREDLFGADLVLAATDDPKLNDEIHSVCKCLGIWVNVCSDQQKCDFQFPGIVKQDEIVIGINAAGTNHKKVKKIRECVEEAFAKGEWNE